MENEIEYIILLLDRKLKKFHKNFVNNIGTLENSLKNLHSNFFYERTISNECKFFITEILEKNKINLNLSVTELSLINRQETDEILKKIKKDVNFTRQLKETWNKMYIDNYFQIEMNNQVKHIFVEYKLNEEIDFFDLAKDFMKFKLYNFYNKDNNCIFVYCVLSKDFKNYASIKTLKPHFEYLTTNIEKTIIKDNKRVYVFTESINSQSLLKDENLFIEEFEIFQTLIKIADISDTSIINYDNGNKSETNNIVNYRSLFHYNVLESEIIRSNYKLISDVYKIKNMNFTLDESFFVNIVLDFQKIQNIIQGKIKEEANNQGLFTSYRPSLFIIILICFYAQYLSSEKNNLYSNINCNPHDGKIIEELIKKLSQNQEKLEIQPIFVESIMYFIIKLYDELFVISDDGSIIEYKEEYKQENDELIKLYRELAKKLSLDFKEEKIDDSSIADFSLKVLRRIVKGDYNYGKKKQ